MRQIILSLLLLIDWGNALDIFEYGSRFKNSKAPMKFIKPEDGLTEVCEGDSFVLHCPAGTKISVPEPAQIQFGRNGPWEGSTRCGVTGQSVDHCSTVSAADQVLSHCLGLEFCGTNLVGWFQAKDPCPALPKNSKPRKYLTIKYSCQSDDIDSIHVSTTSTSTSSTPTPVFRSTQYVDTRIEELETELFDRLDTFETLSENVTDYVSAFFEQALHNIPSESGTRSQTNILNMTERISKRLMEMLNNQDEITSLEFETSQLTVKLVKKNLDESSVTKWESKDKLISLPDQTELLTKDGQDDGRLEIMMAAYQNISNSMNSASDVISVSVSEHVNLSRPVTFLLPNNGDRNVSCAFWSFNQDDWLRDGCVTVCHNDSHTKCSCDHLTNFALIFNVHSEFIAEDGYHATKLQYITYIGFTISIVSMVLTILLFMMTSSNTTDRDVIHVNLCFSLLTAEIIFMFGIDQTSNTSLCTAISIALHYFFLSSFAWMFLEGYMIYELLVKVFQSRRTGRKRHYIIGYGAPLIIVLLALVIDTVNIYQDNDSQDMCFDPVALSSYGTATNCWLNVDNNFILSFIIPAVIVICSNVAMLLFAVLSLTLHKLGSDKTANQDILVSYMKGVVVLMCLLGTTWLFGLLLLAFNNLTIAYTFTTLNSLQGVGIFVFQYVLNPQTKVTLRKMYQRIKPSLGFGDERGKYQRTSCNIGDRSEYSMTTTAKDQCQK